MSRNKFPPKPKYDPDTGPVYLYGLHTVRAALDNPGRLKKVLLATPNALNRLKESGDIGKVPVKETTPKELDRLLGGEAVHQGLPSKSTRLAASDWTTSRGSIWWSCSTS